MLRTYDWRGLTWQFDEKDAPADAVPHADTEAAKPVTAKKRAPRNKAKATATKEA